MSVEFKTIKLYGHLGKKFGKTFNLAVASPAEAVKALSVNIRGFKEYLAKHSYHVFIDKRDISIDEVDYKYSYNTIKIVPVTVGSGRIFKIVLGIALIVASFYIPFLPGGLTSFGVAATTATFNAGVALVIGGVAEILFAPPKVQASSERPENTPSYVFNGPINTVLQGNPVALCYGRLRVGSQVISAGLTSREIPI